MAKYLGKLHLYNVTGDIYMLNTFFNSEIICIFAKSNWGT